MAEEENSEEAAAEGGGGKMKMILFGGIGLVLVAVGIFAGPAVKNMISPPEPEAGEEEAVVAAGPPIYQSLHPPLIINLNDAAGDSHFMQLTMEVMSRDQTTINSVRDNTALIRNALILLYSGAVYEEIQSRDGKEKMLEDGLAEIQRLMTETTGEADVEALYFTALVIQ
jgi:flagellar FliL protein